VFNLIWGVIIGSVIGCSAKLLDDERKLDNISRTLVVAIAGSCVAGSLVGLSDSSAGILASYFGAIFCLAVYPLTKRSWH
jgi:uncharacterized membrane protein YeaQ/YmgE (transglycosylase-associated protein family)